MSTKKHRAALLSPEQVSRREQALATLGAALADARRATVAAARAAYEALELYQPLVEMQPPLDYHQRRDVATLSFVASSMSLAVHANDTAARDIPKAKTVCDALEADLREAR
jgi:multidrug efflux pump subunit AcrA (membrane-fusion protein)